MVRRLAGWVGGTLMVLLTGTGAWAQSSGSAAFNPYPGFFSLANPEKFMATVFGGGFISDKYGVTQEGFQLEQTITPYLGVVGRVTGYQIYMGQGFANPFNPNPTSSGSSRYNFGRFQGGFDFTILPLTHLYILGGADGGDSHNGVLEGDISSWMLTHTYHPVNMLISGVHSWQNGVTSGSFDLRAVVASTENYMFLAGGGGSFYGGSFVPNIQGQGGPDFGVFFRRWALGVDAQAGYGTAHQYGQLTLYRNFSWSD